MSQFQSFQGQPVPTIPSYPVPSLGSPPPPVITQQPYYDQQVGFPGMQMPPPFAPAFAVPTNVPPGLECLTTMSRIFVKQQVEVLEVLFGCETNNKYKIKNDAGQNIFSAKENTDCCTRNCCGKLRPFDINIRNSEDREVIHLSRPFACGSCCFPCCLQSIRVEAPPGQLAGTIEQEWSLCRPHFVVKNASGDIVLRIKGPICTCSCCGSVDFQVLSTDGLQQVGQILKQWSGLLREALTDADNFGISFPVDLDVRVKATLIGACFLIDFMFFEDTDKN